MSNTSSNLPVCIHCGTPRPADETLCPNCGKPWIDVNVEDASGQDATSPAATAAAAAAAAATSEVPSSPPPPQSLDDTGDFDFDDWTLPPETKRSKVLWLIPLVILLGVVALWFVVFIDRDSGDTTPSVVAASTSSTLATTTTMSVTTTDATSTTSSTTTTAVPYPPADSWKAVGDPIPVSDLSLKAAGIGPIDFGTPITESAGALVASLGTADDAGVDSDSCENTEWYWLEWGDLRGIFDGYETDAQFVAYMYESDGSAEPNPMLETLSGIQLGDTVEKLQKTYASYTVSFEVIDGKDYFRLSDGGELLLWGPVTSTEPQGTIEGIYSPDPCPTSS
jgi:guanyl-specific ribonuclease Sa